MSRSLVLLALVAFIACTSVSAQQMTTAYYYGTDAQFCNGTVLSWYNVTLGECKFGPVVDGQPSTVSASFTNNGFSYSYSYTPSFTTNCSDSTAYGASEMAYVTTCTLRPGSTTIYQKITVIGASPALPVGGSFPPSAWSVGTTYWNTTSNDYATQCSLGTDVVVYARSASRMGYCIKHTGTKATAGSYEANYCSGDGTRSGTVVFSDSACTAVLEATVDDIYCQYGTISTCGSAPTFPSYGNAGATIYTNADCSSTHPESQYKTPDACVDGAKFHCGTTNSSTDVVYTSYTDAACTTGANALTFKDNVCTQFSTGVYVKASCSVIPGGSSASTASVSMIAMVVASLVAIFARSL